jgi:hypothetical protein
VAEPLAKLPEDYARVANYLHARARPNERILAALDRHDTTYENPVALYFAAGLLPGTHWHQFDPGLQTRADIQANIVRDLARYNVRWVVRDASFDDIREPNQSSRSSGVFVLDHYLADHYRPVAASGKVAVWLLNSEPAPLPMSPRGKCETFSPVGPSAPNA